MHCKTYLYIGGFAQVSLFPLCSHLIRGYEKIIKRYGLSVSPCMVALCIGIGCVLPKYSPTNVVVDCEYILPTIAMASCRYSRSFMIARSLAWSITPKVFLKSTYKT